MLFTDNGDSATLDATPNGSHQADNILTSEDTQRLELNKKMRNIEQKLAEVYNFSQDQIKYIFDKYKDDELLSYTLKDNPDDVLNAEDRRMLKLAKKTISIEEQLRDVFSFNKEQRDNVFNKNKGDDAYLLEQIVRDVQNQYAKISFDMPINEYLYDLLMGIQPLEIEVRQQEILSKLDDILDGENTTRISYLDFSTTKDSSHNETDDVIHQKARKAMKNYVKQDVQDFFVIHIDIDEDFKKDEEKRDQITSKFLQKHMHRSAEYGVNLYVLVQKDGAKKIIVGSMNGQKAKLDNTKLIGLAQKYNATKVSVPLSRFLKSPQ